MASFEVTINLKGAMLDGDPGPELARLLREVADRAEEGRKVGPIIDTNGNTVGHYWHTEIEGKHNG